MRRVSYFVLLGPLLAWLTLAALLLPEAIGKPFSLDASTVVVSVLASYFVSVGPLLVLAGVEKLLARRALHRIVRIGACAIAGYGIALAIVLYWAPAFGGRRGFAEYTLWFGLLGAVSAAVCSLLSGDKKSTATPP
jgi:hypothetical protein